MLILMMTLVVDRSVREALLSEVDDNLVIAAQLASEGLPDDNADLQTWAEDVFRASSYRTTLIATDDAQGRTTWLLLIHKLSGKTVSEGRIWSRKLWLWTIL